MYAVVITVSIIFLACVSTHDTPCPAPCPNYYWRDYTRGIIPDDAFAGARNGNDTLYVAQAFFSLWELLPASIHSKTGLATSGAYGKVLVTNEYVKVLASPDNSIFEWVPTDIDSLHFYLNRAVLGRSEVNATLYIGRIHHDKEWLLGKIFTADRPNKGFWHVKDEQTVVNKFEFDLLVYNCNKGK